MIKRIVIFGLAAGGILALGKLSAAQWHGVGVALLALTLRYGLTVLPWLLVVFFAWRYVRWKRTALAWIDFGKLEMSASAARREAAWEQQQAAARRPQRRKRRTA
jgi:hypothetical protein